METIDQTPGEREMTLAEAKAEEEQATVPSPTQTVTEPEPEQEESALEQLQPSAEVREWTFEMGGEKRTYAQKPLSFGNKMEFFSLLGETISNAMDTGLTVDGMLGSVIGLQNLSDLDPSQLKQADAIVAGLAKFTQYSPELINDCFCIWLHVPYNERVWAKAAMNRSEDEGGLSDDDGFAIIELFIDQNWDAMSDFFSRRVRQLADRVTKRRLAKSRKKEGKESSKR